nr:putative thioesterase [uncultured bacterium]
MRPRGDVERWLSAPTLDAFADAPLRLVCVAHAGAGPSAFRGWQARVPAGVLVCPVQLPGREGRWHDPPYTRMDDLAGALAAALAPALGVPPGGSLGGAPARPYALFGHSLGALVCYELALRLRTAGAPPPRRLVVSGARPPHLPRRELRIGHLPDGPFVLALARQLNGIPAAVLEQPELVRVLLPALRADMAVYESYAPAPAPPLDVPITAYGGRDDARVVFDDVVHWGRYTARAFRYHMFAGDHFYPSADPDAFLRVLGGELAADLAGGAAPARGPLPPRRPASDPGAARGARP